MLRCPVLQSSDMRTRAGDDGGSEGGRVKSWESEVMNEENAHENLLPHVREAFVQMMIILGGQKTNLEMLCATERRKTGCEGRGCRCCWRLHCLTSKYIPKLPRLISRLHVLKYNQTRTYQQRHTPTASNSSKADCIQGPGLEMSECVWSESLHAANAGNVCV